MRRTPHFLLEDPDEVKRLIRDNPWATFVAQTATGLVASHYPVLLDESDTEGITVLSHVGRPDERALELGAGELMLVIQGPHGYISPSWYPEGQVIPTWNHVTAHLYGVPELLDDAENFRVLTDLVDHFEARMPEPRALAVDVENARRVALGTVGIRMRITRFDARAKLSQNKPTEVRERIVRELEGDGPYTDAALAAEMRRIVPHAAP